MAPCDRVAKHPLPCESHSCFQKFKISASEFSTVAMHKRFRAYEFLTMVTEGVVHSVRKVVTRSSFGVVW